MNDKNNVGRKILDNTESKNLVQCTFRTSAYNKKKLIDKADSLGLTLSETLSYMLTYRFEEEEYQEKFNEILRIFLREIVGDNEKKAKEYKSILQQIIKKQNDK